MEVDSRFYGRSMRSGLTDGLSVSVPINFINSSSRIAICLDGALTVFSGFIRQEEALRLVELQHSVFACPWRRQAVDGEHLS